jgi:hypothetical protein
LSGGRCGTVKAFIQDPIGSTRLNAILGAGFGLLHLATQDHLAVFGLQVEQNLSVFRLIDLKLSRHGILLLG